MVEPKQRFQPFASSQTHSNDFQLEFFLVLRDARLATHQRPETQSPQVYAEVAVGNGPPPAVSVAPPSSPAELSHTTHSRHPEPSSTARARDA